ncbi:MAG: hypothetical protein R6V86_00670 [Spirochaetia bacterium]
MQPLDDGEPVGDHVEKSGGGGKDEGEYPQASQKDRHDLVRLESRGAARVHGPLEAP